MTEAMVEVALETLSSLIQKKLVLFLGVRGEMRRLSSVLTTIKAVLEDAEEKQLTDKPLQNWLRKLRDAAYLLDDILDECSTHALSLEYQDKVQASCLCSFNPTHVTFRYKIAKKLKGISQRLDEIAEEKSRFHLRETAHERRNEVMEWRQTTSIITEPHFYGREADKDRIVKFLTVDASNSAGVSVYPILGIGGLGKTTLAQRVFQEEKVVSHFELRIWVCVSDNFNLKRLSKDIIESATKKPCGDLGLDTLLRWVKDPEVLGRKRYLLVLDDMWDEKQEEWDKLKSVLACGSKGASILVTTRLTTVARITGTVSPHQLSLLSENECWELFRRRAFGSEKEAREELITIGRDIVRKCDRVPLAAKTLGSLLRFQSTKKEWLRVKESEIWNLSQEEDSILPVLRLSYLNLSPKSRRCFSYLALFPKDKIMSKKQVIELWMANGFLSTNGGFEVEDDGDRVWNELNLKSFFVNVVTVEFAYDTQFKIHDLVHDLAKSVMEEECYSGTFENGPLGERTSHLSLDDIDRFPNLWSSHLNKVKSLKTFIMLQDYYSGANTWCDRLLKCYHLQALDLKFSNEVSSSIDRLKHLRYLNLSYGNFRMLPNSICRLWNLQILTLNECRSLEKLPNQLKCLKSLRHLHLKMCRSLSTLAPEMHQLTCLRTLSIYIVGVQEGFLLEEIGNLKLEGTLCIRNLERVKKTTDAEKANLADKCLDELKLLWERDEQSQLQENEETILEALQPHTQLKRLFLRGYLGTQLPQWMINPTLKDLICLEINGCENLVCISCLAKLPSLESLELRDMKDVQYIDEGSCVDGVDRGFQALQYLWLSRLPSLVKLSREDGDNMFPHLSNLYITRCPQLNLPFLPSVTQLQLGEGCSRALHGLIQNLPNVEDLRLTGDRELTSLPDVGGCPKFKLSASFGSLIALEHRTIDGRTGAEDNHDASRHIMALRFLHLYDLPNLASLPDWLGNLRLLYRLCTHKCPKLVSLPMSTQSLTNLKWLSIKGCPELGKRCKEGTGEDWHKIAHVPHRCISD